MESPKPYRILAYLLALGLVAASCGSSSDSADTTSEAGEETDKNSDDTVAPSSEPIQLGYSAWPGWFPIAVTEEKGIFEEVGVEVELTFFADYLGSLDAMAAGQLDGNTQTLNDTMFSVAAGDEQVIVVTNDNSAGNDAIICDESVESIEDLEGKTVSAEAGVVDHFLLLQGLDSVGLAENDVDFRGVLTDAAAAAFAAGEFDCVGVFAPFTLQALEREGSNVLFSSADFPGTISDHIVVTPELIEERPGDVQKLVDAWYLTLEWIEENPDEAAEIMAGKAELTPVEYAELADGTDIFDAEKALGSFGEQQDASSLRYVAELINPFLVESELTETEAPLDGLFDSSFTQTYVDSQ